MLHPVNVLIDTLNVHRFTSSESVFDTLNMCYMQCICLLMH